MTEIYRTTVTEVGPEASSFIAQGMLALATRVLMLWLVLFALTLVIVPPVEKDSGSKATPPAEASAPEMAPSGT